MVATEIVNVREKADKNSEIEAIVATDEEVIVTAETSDGWYKVTYGDYSGYVMKDYLKKAEVTTTSAAKSETTTAAKKSETKRLRQQRLRQQSLKQKDRNKESNNSKFEQFCYKLYR